MRFVDIPKFTSDGSYNVDIPVNYIERTLADYKEAYGLELNPDFQRGNVWTATQQERWLPLSLLACGSCTSIASS